MLNIKEATAADAPLIAQLSQQTFAETFAAHNKPQDMQLFFEEQFTLPQLAAEVGLPQHIFYLAYAHGKPVGYMKLRLVSHEAVPSSIEIARIYATQQSVGTGVGKTLMQQAVTTAQAMGRKALWLGVWEHNLRALKFYAQWGFVPFGEHPFLLGRDLQRDLLLKKEW